MTKAKNLQTDWNLKLLYQSETDPKIEKDIKKIEKLIDQFEKKYKNEDSYLTSDDFLLEALTEYENLSAQMEAINPLPYFSLSTSLNSKNELAQSLKNKYIERLTKADNKIVFFSLKLGQITPENQQKFLKSNKLSKYHYYLKRRFLSAKYDLPEIQEQTISLFSNPAYRLWVSGLQKTLNQKTVKYEGKSIPVTEALVLISELPTAKRRSLNKLCMKEFFSLADFAESELNAIVTAKRIEDDLRKLEKPYTARIISEENDEKTVLNLVDTVTSDFKTAHKFYDLKAKLLKQKTLTYADRSALIGKIDKKYSYENAYEIIDNTFRKYDKSFSDVLKNMAHNGQVDVYPKVGKRGGAFCLGWHKNPTFIMLNHKDNLYSLTTYAHETGHAIHTELSKSQPVIYEDYSLSIAETASTFFETLVMSEIMKGLSEKERIILLHDQIQDAISTIYRQIAAFNFELELHNSIKEKGSLSHKELAVLMNKHMAAYLGKTVSLDNLDGYFFVYWSHLRRPFYVYTYAFGLLVSLGFVELVESDNKNIEKVIKFLSAGGSDTPENILKSVGIDVTKPDFFKRALGKIHKDLKTLESTIS